MNDGAPDSITTEEHPSGSEVLDQPPSRENTAKQTVLTPGPSQDKFHEKPKPNREESDPNFETLWQYYPARGIPSRKQGKARALKVWNQLKKNRELPSPDILMRLLDADKESRQWKDPQYIPLATTWLNSRPWKDMPHGEAEQPSSGSVLLDMYYRGELKSSREESGN